MLERQRSHFQRLMVQAGKAGGRVRETLALLDELRAAPVRGDLRQWISTLASSGSLLFFMLIAHDLFTF